MTRPPRDERFMDLCRSALTWGTCPRARVGAVVARGGAMLGPIGYNGAPSGQPHCDEAGCLMDSGHCIRALHAEKNALKRTGYDNCQGATLYTTHFPCYACANEIADAGIARVVYEDSYRVDQRALRLLMSACQVDQLVDGVAHQVVLRDVLTETQKDAILKRAQRETVDPYAYRGG